MLGASLVPSRWRKFYDPMEPGRPGKYNRQITPFLQKTSTLACTHPIHTIVVLAIIASSTYISLLETGLFEPSTPAPDKLDYSALAAGSRRLHLGPETSWKWQTEEQGAHGFAGQEELSLITLTFGESYLSGSSAPEAIPLAQAVPIPSDTQAEILPPRSSSSSGDDTLAFALPSQEAPRFLTAVREIPSAGETVASDSETLDDVPEQKRWIMKAAKGAHRPFTLRNWAKDSWTAFSDLIKVC